MSLHEVLLIQNRHSGYIQVLPCNTKHLTAEMAAKWTASQWMSNWDVPSEILTVSGKEFIETWWENMCGLLGVHHLRARVYDHRALPAEPAGRILINILRKFLATEEDYNWLETIYCVLRRYHRTKNYTGVSPHELVFGREKMGPGPVMYHPRQCYDASQWFERIKDLESKRIQAKVKSQADWLKFKNQSRTQGKSFEKGQQVWLRKSDGTLKDDNKLLPLWEGPFQVTSSFELEKILDYKKNARNKWYFLCRWKGFGPEEDKWEPASSFIHGYTDTFIKFLKKHPEIDRELSLIKDCVTKEDLQAQEEAPIVADSI